MSAEFTPELSARLGAIAGVLGVALHDGGVWVEAPGLDVHAMNEAMAALGIRLGTITARPLSVQGETVIIYHYIALTTSINFKTLTRGGALPSLADRVPAASWAEREIKDLFGVDFPGHPNLVPLMKPKGFEDGMLRAAMCGPVLLPRSPTSKRPGGQEAP